MGVSVEDNRVKHRVDHLKRTNAEVKFLSCEPLIGSLDEINFEGINWVIVGGESGHKARPIGKEWVLEIKEQCDRFNVPFFFKQWGKPIFNPNPDDPTIQSTNLDHAKGGCRLNGRIYHTFPKKQKSQDDLGQKKNTYITGEINPLASPKINSSKSLLHSYHKNGIR